MTTTIDQHLQDQERLNASFLATIAPVVDDSELVQITPYLGGHCACEHAFRLRKQDLEIEPTETTTSCCGKTLRVFRVYVKPGAQVPAADHVRHVLRAAVTPRRLGDCAQGCLDSFNGCLEAAQDDEQRRSCSDDYRWCVADCSSSSRPRLVLGPVCNCAQLEALLEVLQLELQQAPPNYKPGLLRQITKLRDKMEFCGC
jgi:hypothetical protein